MPTKHLPKAVFEAGAAAIARIHIASAEPISSIARGIWSQYERSCSDPTAVEDWIVAAGQLVSWIQDETLPAPAELLRHLQHFCQKYEDDGSPKKMRLFNGLLFAKDAPDARRVDRFFRKAQVYCAAAQGGLVPLAPSDYQ
jgi:hypothetical protein